MQPSVKISAAVAERAFSRDALVQRDILTGLRSSEECEKDILLAIGDYQLAKKLGFRYGRGTVDDRVLILKSLIKAENRSSDDVAEEDAKKKALSKLFLLLNKDESKLRILLAALARLSPITEESNGEYLKALLDAADGDSEKAKQIQEIIERGFFNSEES